MSHSKKESYKFRINPVREKDEWVNVSILDGNDNLIMQQTGSFSMDLPKGLYTVMTEAGGYTTQRVVRHDKDNTYEITFPDLKPSEKGKKTINFSKIASEQSKIITFGEKQDTGRSARLFLFFNVSNSFDFDKTWLEIYKKISLYNDDNQRIIKLNEDENYWNINKKQGWLAFQCISDPGIYYLSYKGVEKRSFPIVMFPGKQTQVFLPFKEEPYFESMRIALSNFYWYNPDVPEDKSFIIALDKLHNRDFNLSEKVLKDLVYSKWENPMYGIVVSYIYLKSGSRKFDDLFDEVVDNLSEKILDDTLSADLRIIRLLKNIHTESETDARKKLKTELPFEMPPMLRIGMETLIELSFEYPNLIEENGLVDLISDRLYYDTVWTCFKPSKSTYTIASRKARTGNFSSLYAYKRKPLKNLGEVEDWLKGFLPALVDMIDNREDNRAAKKQISSKELAAEMRISTVTFNRKVRELSDMLQKDSEASALIIALLSKWLDKKIDKEKLLVIINRLK